MTPRLETTVFSTQTFSPSEAKFVDEAPRMQGFSWGDAASSAALGSRRGREIFRPAGPRPSAKSADETLEAEIRQLAERRIVPAHVGPGQYIFVHSPEYVAAQYQIAADIVARRLGSKRTSTNNARLTDQTAHGPTPAVPVWELVAADKADLDREEKHHQGVIDYLPAEWKPFLEKMSEARRREREAAILDYVGWDGLEVLDMTADELAEKAKTKAARYAAQYPVWDPVASEESEEKETVLTPWQGPEHRKGRCEKTQCRKLRKLQRRVVMYVGAAIGAVGGPDVPGRALYVPDYAVKLFRQHERRTANLLENLVIQKESDLRCLIGMTELNARAKIATVTKRRLLIDMMLARWEALSWHVAWITVTLPGEFVPHATNEASRQGKGWNEKLGQAEAFAAIQDDHHRVMALLHDKGIRPSGWWNVQPQQSGTPHRHYVLACSTIEDARVVCDTFKAKFSNRLTGKGGQDRGCDARVIGDDHPDYSAGKGKNGKEETAASIARYAARYSTRLETVEEAEDEEVNDNRPAGEFERYNVWKWGAGCRTFALLGTDFQRAPMELWDTLYSHSGKSTKVDDPRMMIAMNEMKKTKAAADEAIEWRKQGLDDSGREMAERAAFHAWHAAIALGMWPDTDLDPQELAWLRDAVKEWNKAHGETEQDPLPPMPHREAKTSIFDETYNVVVGAVGAVRKFDLPLLTPAETWLRIAQAQNVPVEGPKAGRIGIRHVKKALLKAGISLSRRPDGRISGFVPAGEVLLRVEDEWTIVDKETAQARIEELEVREAQAQRIQDFYDSPECQELRDTAEEEALTLWRKARVKAEALGMILTHDSRGRAIGDALRYIQSFSDDALSVEYWKKREFADSLFDADNPIYQRGLSFIATDPSCRPEGPHSGREPQVEPPPS